MTEIQASWVAQLPPQMRAAIEREDAKEAIAARAEQQERKARAEDWREANMALFQQAAASRGEVVGAMQLARGEVTGRTIGDVLSEARRASEIDDAREQARATRGIDGGLAHCFVGEAVIHHAPARRSGLALQMYNRGTAFLERARARRAAEDARERELDVLPLAQAVQISKREDGVVYAGPSQRSSVLEARDQRAGGPEAGYGPANVPWSTVAEWVARGWTP